MAEVEVVVPQTCARCGHTTPTCEHCDREWPWLGASTGLPGGGVMALCHTFVEKGSRPSCYELHTREAADAMWDGLFEQWKGKR